MSGKREIANRIALTLFLVTFLAIATFSFFSIFKKISYLEKSVYEVVSVSKQKTVGLEKQIAVLEEKIIAITGENQKVASSLKEIENRQAVKEKTQEELVTAAVAKVAPGVVSIVATKDMPKIEVVYQNPFGDDPYFKNFNFQIPVLRQKGTERTRVGAGTGFFVTTDGFIITNKHVVIDEVASYAAFLPDGKSKQVFVLYRDPVQDIAVLKVVGESFKALTLGDSKEAKLGQTVIAIGNALGEYDNSVSIGIVSGLNRTINAEGQGLKETLSGVIQTDAAINLGNSGGPLVDINGKVIGVNVATAVGSNSISFSIPINSVKEILEKVIGRPF